MSIVRIGKVIDHCSSTTWIIQDANYYLGKMKLGQYFRSPPFLQHGKYWIAKFSPRDGDVEIFLAEGSEHYAKFSVEVAAAFKITTNKCLFTKFVPWGFEKFVEVEQVVKCIEVDGSLKLIIKIFE